jgi:hypothetical protein
MRQTVFSSWPGYVVPQVLAEEMECSDGMMF